MDCKELISSGKGVKPKSIIVTFNYYYDSDSGMWKHCFCACIMPEDIPIREEDFSGDPDELRKIAEEISQEYPEYLVYILWHE